MAERYVTIEAGRLLVGESLPCALYLFIDGRFITFRAKGDLIDRVMYDRLELKKVKFLFVTGQEEPLFEAWVKAREKEEKKEITPEAKPFLDAREEVKRRAMDIFTPGHSDRIITQTVESSKKLVAEVMKFPFATKTLQQLQTYSRGTLEHSLNVSVLSVYLALHMGYSHTLILHHLGLGGLLHDMGKPLVEVNDGDDDVTIEAKMCDHPDRGVEALEALPNVPQEVKMIVGQHHEHFDGSGFPKGLRGNSIYDLARIVSIANAFDGLVGDASGTLQERQRYAMDQLDTVYFKRFDPLKLEKALKILSMGL